MGIRALRVVILTACLLVGASVHAQTVTVLAAASLRESFTTLAKEFESGHPGAHVRITFAGSQQLAATILLDAPADVFASADERQMDRVEQAGKAEAAGFLCSNRLVIAVRPGLSHPIRAIADLGRPGVRVVLAKPEVPAGEYSEKVLAKLPSQVAAAIRANVVSRENDVRTVLTRVRLGEADAGIVYSTDAISAGTAVITAPIPAKLQTPVKYLIATLRRSGDLALARAFVALTRSKEGVRVLRAHGFLPGPARRS